MATPALTWLKRTTVRLRLDRDWYLILLAAGIGLLMSGVALAFMLPLHAVETLVRRLEADHPGWLWWLIPIVPVIGALICGIVTRLIPEGEGEGPAVSRVMYCIYRRKSRVRWFVALRTWLAASATIGSGNSAGAEGPIVTIGATIGSNIGRTLGTMPQNTAALLGCGAAAGIASVFNAPIAGVFFVLEVMLRDFSLRTFTPIVVASVISATVTQAVLHSSEPLFPGAAGLELEQAFHWAEIPNYLILGVICGVAGALFIRALYGTMRLFQRSPIPRPLRPLVGAIGLGAAGVAWWSIAGRTPEFYGNGYPVIAQLLDPVYYLADDGSSMQAFSGVFGLLVVLALVKGIATCLTIGSGGAGGVFAPSLLLGTAIGGAFGFVVNTLGWFPSATPAHYALVGMAAMLAGSTHAPLTAILIVYEITQRYEVILPLMFAAVISTIVARIVHGQSVYSQPLAQLGVRVGEMSDLTILRRLTAHDVPLVAPVFVRPADSAQRLLDLSERLAVSDFVVTDARSRYLGMVTSGAVRDALVYREAIPLLQVHELQQQDLPTVSPEDTLDVVLDRFAAHDVNALTVVDEGTDGAVIGLITRSRLMRRYQVALEDG